LEKKVYWCIDPHARMKELRRNTVFVNFALDRFLVQATWNSCVYSQDFLNGLNFKLQDIRKAHHLGVFDDSPGFLKALLKIAPAKKVTILLLRQTETEEDIPRLVSEQLRHMAFLLLLEKLLNRPFTTAVEGITSIADSNIFGSEKC
jgi:hypothetical protein